MRDLFKLSEIISKCGHFKIQNEGYLQQSLTADQTFVVTSDSGNDVTCLFNGEIQDYPNILYFHDSALADYTELQDMAENYRRHKINFITIEYCWNYAAEEVQAFGTYVKDSPDFVAAVKKWLEANSCTGPLFVMGRSLGALIAMEGAVSNEEGAKGLFLESPFCMTIPFFKALGLTETELNLTEDEGFNCLEILSDYKSPTLFFHGAKDVFVTIGEAEKLQSYSGARNKQFFVIPGADRSNLQVIGGDLYYETIKKFIDTVCGTNTWREKRRKFKKGQK